jgi:hypothetical protein
MGRQDENKKRTGETRESRHDEKVIRRTGKQVDAKRQSDGQVPWEKIDPSHKTDGDKQ